MSSEERKANFRAMIWRMDYASVLNEQQYKAVTTSSQYVRVIAGAGSGKTRVLTYRIAYLVGALRVPSSKILAIAFTNKVAQEMSNRASNLVDEMLGFHVPLSISTFHAFCARFLRIESKSINYPRTYAIWDESDFDRAVKNAGVACGYKKGDDQIKKAGSYIRLMKGINRYPEDISVSSWNEDEKVSLKIYEEYEKIKRASFALDFDDLLLLTIRVLENNSEIREHWSHKYQHILIDEFQDTNDIQFRLLSLLQTPETSVYVVGDPDQTIYTWRGANPKNIMDFSKHFLGAETIILNQNYRSTGKILEAANKLISHNNDRVKKDLFTKGEEGEDIKTFEAFTAEKEAEWVVRGLVRLANKYPLEDGRPNYLQSAILYRSAYLTRPIERALKNEGIPYRIYGGVRFYERMEVKDLLSYCSLLINPKDSVAFERIINVPRRSIGEKTLLLLKQEASRHSLQPLEYVMALATDSTFETEIKGNALNSLKDLGKAVIKAQENLNGTGEALSSIIHTFADDISYFEYLKETEENGEDRIENVQSLFDDMDDYVTKHPEADLSSYLQQVSLLSAQDDINDGNYVSLMTVHVAKGLEFDNVFVIDFQEGAFPNQRALEEDGRDAEEEERRLAYVAFTRARKRLFVSCNDSYSYATDSHGAPSPYYAEAGLKVQNDSPSFYRPNSSSFYRQNSFKKQNGGFSFFGDGEHISPFNEKRRKEEEMPKTNGITDWKVGDLVEHKKFGRGKVIALISDEIIQIDFEKEGKKLIVPSHAMLSRLKSPGGEA